MVEALSNILSVSFNRLNENKLEIKEVKNYAASNIMLNVELIFRKIVSAIINNP